MTPKILLFRASSDNDSKGVDSYEDFLSNYGISAFSVPVLQFQFINLDKLAEKLCQPHSFSGLVFTSPRSVEAVHSCLEDHQVNISSWTQHSIYVVGEATGQLVQKKLQLPSKGQESGSAAILAQYIINDDLLNRDKPLLFPSADIKKDTLPCSLRAAGIPLDSLTVYETKIRADLASVLQVIFNTEISKPKGLVFFSPSGVGGVLDALQTLSMPITDFKCFAIGPSTEEALRSRGVDVAGTAAKPNAACLLQSLQQGHICQEKQ